MIRLKDVAQVAGVSEATASRALNDMPEVGADTTARVKRVAAALGYQKGARRDLTERVWSLIDTEGPTPVDRPELGCCWAFGANKGYAYIDGVKAARVIYELVVGPIPDGLELDHLCRNPFCVNPAHLEPVTHAENIRRARRWTGKCHKGHEMTPENTLVLPSRPLHHLCLACRRESNRAMQQRRRKG